MPLAAVHGVAREAIVLIVGVVAGIANGIAGGGTLFTFPVLLALGLPALTANVSSSVGVLPSYMAGIAGFRERLVARRPLLVSLSPVCVLGSLVGTALLLGGTPATFRTVVPWLIGVATLCFAAQPLVVRAAARVPHDHPTRRVLLQAGTFVIAVYGGYFGAGVGIMLLAVMGLALPDDLTTLSGLRSVLSILINAVAAVVFVIRGHLAWDVVVCLWIGTAIGGIGGTALVKSLRPSLLRAVIIVIGAATTIRLAIG
ncbi:MAG TPA: sulfite exporter TauE/SafE family protein [Acidimicrobiales bacterium]|jgi:hypothetical protein|nr:sulfite exporter TauE/SafE family protein [Acidimicrobiales bacterium]